MVYNILQIILLGHNCHILTYTIEDYDGGVDRVTYDGQQTRDKGIADGYSRVSVSNTFIACLLTIVGYSINATIVIFDRVRENMAVMTKKDDLQDVVNHSITQTLSRSLFTSLTTLVMVGALYIWGVTSIRDFALPLMVGIICGAYSSVCIAGALWYVLRKKFAPKAK